MDKIKSIIEYAMQMEKNASVFYEHYVDNVKTQETKDLFSELAQIELKHYDVLKKTYDLLNYKEPPQAISWVVDSTSRELNNPILSDNSDLINSVSSVEDLNILRMAFIIEEDFANFYKKASEQTEIKSSKDFLDELVTWELQHANLLKSRYEIILSEKWKDINSFIR